MFWKTVRAIDWLIDGMLYPVAWVVFRIRLWMLLRRVKKIFEANGVRVPVASITGTLSRSSDSVKRLKGIEIEIVKRSK